MSTKRHRETALFFVGALFSDRDIYNTTAPLISEHMGKIIIESPEIPWEHSSYYTDELGAPISRKFLFFDRITESSLLSELKIFTDGLEEMSAAAGKRRINLDPGYLTEAKVVLGSTKNYSHRIYLGEGIYAEQEYVFSRGCYKPLPHAYHDYCKPEYIDLFMQARGLFRTMLAVK